MTRYEQFKARQKKWSDKRRRINRHNAKLATPAAAPHHGGGKRWNYEEEGVQRGLDVSSRSYSADPEAAEGLPTQPFTVSPAGYSAPPHVKITAPAYLATRAAGVHQQEKFVGYHIRRVKRVGEKTTKMNGHARKSFGAYWRAMTTGYYPTWDPLKRHPDTQDALNGAPPAGIVDWRWGVTGNYP